ncbi:MAG TPA: NRDE family protein [Chloroflexota bacterium]|nr:NRDE family protein [Chloroflexota bacterium]
MCTIITLFQVHPTFPLVIAANRDERYDRPSSGPSRLIQPAATVAGRDLRFGGTWFGVNRYGLAVAVADQEPAPGPPAPRSRGLLVLDALGCPDSAAVRQLLARVPPQDYQPFSLLYATPHEAWLGHHTASGVQLQALAPGLHVLVSSRGSDHAARRQQHIMAQLTPSYLVTLAAEPLVETLTAVLRDHAAGDQNAAICRHGSEAGTVSSFVVLLTPTGVGSVFRCADGPPCRAPYVDHSPLLAETLVPVSPPVPQRES